MVDNNDNDNNDSNYRIERRRVVAKATRRLKIVIIWINNVRN